LNWQWLLNDILKLFKWYSNERKAVGSGHVRKDRAHRFFVRVVFVLFETRRFCKVERFVFPDLLVIIQCFHICSFLSKTSAYMGRHFYFLMSFQSVFRGLRQGLAKENTAAKRG